MIPNDITLKTPASFEPSIDYVVTKIPRFAFEKFPGAQVGAAGAVLLVVVCAGAVLVVVVCAGVVLLLLLCWEQQW